MEHSSPASRRNSPAAADLSAADYVRLLHPPGSIGKVSFTIIRSRDEAITRTYSVETAPMIVESLLDESTYLTLNRFNGPRDGCRLAQLNALYLDLDVHRLPGSNQPHEHWVEKLHMELDAKSIPRPSVVIFTGRGLAAIWLIDPLPKKARARWSACLSCLIGLFKHLGADSACSDAPRVFRVPGTTNLKAGAEVRTIDGTLLRYPFDALADRIFEAAGRPTRRQLSNQKAAQAGKPRSGEPHGLAPRKRFAMISSDLDKIVSHWGGHVPEGKRNTFLHLVATCLTHTAPEAEIENEVFRTAAIATPGLSEREVVGIIRSAERQAQKACSSTPALDGRLHYTGARIAELLEISDDVARTLGLEQVFSKEERARRKASREKERRMASGATSREEWLSQNSASREQPWKAGGMSRTKWYELGLHKALRPT
ncbi:hypothetical protein [Litorisediminicola beolgyonensis]|uniref:RepB-like DNA primase domain-containing protein n=1 Tax=Litorisediminicola beolgyonensis TaxID=1173614 RepID=A0ABW3ZIJ6_9RHOB